MPRDTPSLKSKALTCIAQREHSRIELKRKLLAHSARQAREAARSPLAEATDVATSAEDEVETLLDWLVEKDLLSSQRFVDLRVQVRSARFGNLRIRHELSQHGHSLDADALRTLESSELARARAVWARRFGGVDSKAGADAAGRAKQARFLAARGFSADVVRRVVNGTSDD